MAKTLNCVVLCKRGINCKSFESTMHQSYSTRTEEEFVKVLATMGRNVWTFKWLPALRVIVRTILDGDSTPWIGHCVPHVWSRFMLWNTTEIVGASSFHDVVVWKRVSPSLLAHAYWLGCPNLGEWTWQYVPTYILSLDCSPCVDNYMYTKKIWKVFSKLKIIDGSFNSLMPSTSLLLYSSRVANLNLVFVLFARDNFAWHSGIYQLVLLFQTSLVETSFKLLWSRFSKAHAVLPRR